MRVRRFYAVLFGVIAAALAIVPVVSAHSGHGSSHQRTKHSSKGGVPHYQHVVEIMMENTSYGSIIGNSKLLRRHAPE